MSISFLINNPMAYNVYATHLLLEVLSGLIT
jgi:hypothetical protein